MDMTLDLVRLLEVGVNRASFNADARESDGIKSATRLVHFNSEADLLAFDNHPRGIWPPLFERFDVPMGYCSSPEATQLVPSQEPSIPSFQELLSFWEKWGACCRILERGDDERVTHLVADLNELMALRGA